MNRTQKEVLRYIVDYKMTNGCSPTIREIASGCHVCITHTYRTVVELQELGYLSMQSKRARTIKVLRFV